MAQSLEIRNQVL